MKLLINAPPGISVSEHTHTRQLVSKFTSTSVRRDVSRDDIYSDESKRYTEQCRYIDTPARAGLEYEQTCFTEAGLQSQSTRRENCLGPVVGRGPHVAENCLGLVIGRGSRVAGTGLG